MQFLEYKEEYVEKQVTLGRLVTRFWQYYYQSDVEYILKVYAQKDFDPSLKFYIFEGQTLKGFITGKRNNNIIDISPPISDYKEIAESLFDYMIKTLDARNIEEITITYAKQWNNFHLLSKYNFVFKEAILSTALIEDIGFFSGIIKFSNLNVNEYHLSIYKENEKEEIATILSNVIGYSKQDALQILSSPDPFHPFCTLTLYHKDNIIGWCRAHEEASIIRCSPGYISDPIHDVARLLFLQEKNRY